MLTQVLTEPFARILSNACFSRKQHPILRDIFDDSAPLTPFASIEVADDEDEPSTFAFDGTTEHTVLREGFIVFDSAVAQQQLKDGGPIGFTPTGFDVFSEVARAYGALQACWPPTLASGGRSIASGYRSLALRPLRRKPRPS